MNRADLSWALDAVLPHVGKTKGTTVGLQSHAGRLHVYACDNYTAGIARIDGPQDWCLSLRRGEAQDLMRFVRPTLKAHQDEAVSVAVRGAELHIGTLDDSAVFELSVADAPPLGTLLDLVQRIAGSSAVDSGIVVQPALVKKFAQAARHDDDTLRWYPRKMQAHGQGVVTVGTDFVGLIAGMTVDGRDAGTLGSFLQNAEAVAS